MTKREREILQAVCKYNSPKVVTVSEEKAFFAGAKWADKTMIDKACDVLRDLTDDRLGDSFINDFRRRLEEQ